MLADSDHDANMLYATGMFIPDAFIYFRLRGARYAVLSDLEIDRARKHAPHLRLLSLSRYQDKLREAGVKQPGFVEVISTILRERGIKRLTVPHNFPYGIAAGLSRNRIRLKARPGTFFSDR